MVMHQGQVRLKNPQTRLQRRMLKKYGDVWYKLLVVRMLSDQPLALVGTHPTVRKSQDHGAMLHWHVQDCEPIDE